MKVVLAGGGTGGHVYPALAMGEALQRRGHEILYYGDPDRLEGRVVPQKGIPFVPLKAPQYPRAGLVSKLRFLWSLLGAVAESRAQLRRDQVGAVLGVGGYISAPPVLAAFTLGIPRAVHEANVTPGLANRLCARVADLVLLTYEATGPRLPGKAPRELVGCPINPSVLQGDRRQALSRYGLRGERPVVLVVGGSLGARTINQLGLALARLPDRAFDLVLVSGPAYHAELSQELGPLPEGIALVGYEDRMPDAYALASLVVCRAGSSTLAELCAIGKPSLLIPSPNVTDNHQEGNARGLESVGAARVLVERGLDLPAAARLVAELAADAAALARMAEAARAQGRPGTADRVAELMEGRLLSGRSG